MARCAGSRGITWIYLDRELVNTGPGRDVQVRIVEHPLHRGAPLGVFSRFGKGFPARPLRNINKAKFRPVYERAIHVRANEARLLGHRAGIVPPPLKKFIGLAERHRNRVDHRDGLVHESINDGDRLAHVIAPLRNGG